MIWSYSMKRIISMIFVILFSFVLQTTLFQKLSFGQISPNLLIIVTASYGFMYGKRYGMSVGFVCGLLMDIFYGNILGFYALVFLYIGTLNGVFHRVFYQDDIKLPLALISGSDFIYSLICYILLFLLRGRFHFLFYMEHIIFPELIYTIFITIFLYPVILFINNSIDNSEKRGDRKLAKKD